MNGDLGNKDIFVPEEWRSFCAADGLSHFAVDTVPVDGWLMLKNMQTRTLT